MNWTHPQTTTSPFPHPRARLSQSTHNMFISGNSFTDNRVCLRGSLNPIKLICKIDHHTMSLSRFKEGRWWGGDNRMNISLSEFVIRNTHGPLGLACDLITSVRKMSAKEWTSKTQATTLYEWQNSSIVQILGLQTFRAGRQQVWADQFLRRAQSQILKVQ